MEDDPFEWAAWVGIRFLAFWGIVATWIIFVALCFDTYQHSDWPGAIVEVVVFPLLNVGTILAFLNILRLP